MSWTIRLAGAGSSRVVDSVDISSCTTPLQDAPLGEPATTDATIDLSTSGTIWATNDESGVCFEAS